jgi:hypothetical protein
MMESETPGIPRRTLALSPFRDPISQNERHRFSRTKGRANRRTNSGNCSISTPDQ